MKDAVLTALFKIPDPINADEFSRRTGKTASAVRHMMDRRLLPMVTEREVLGAEGSTRRLFILWNEWLEMVHEATGKLPPERQDWRAGWIKKANKLASDMGVNMFNSESAA
ncbi:MAG: Cox family DNA-binding protein [Serratia sp. (in: enterobacteria)]